MKKTLNTLKRIISFSPFIYKFLRKIYLSLKNRSFFIPLDINNIDPNIRNKKYFALNLNNIQKIGKDYQYFLIFQNKSISTYSKEKLIKLIELIKSTKIDVAYDGSCPNQTEIVSKRFIENYSSKLNLEKYPHRFFYFKNNFSIKSIGSSHREYNFNGSFLLPSGGKTIGDSGDVTFRLNFIPDLSGKSFLDIGSEEGYAVFTALNRNAEFAKGLNIFEDKEYDVFPDRDRTNSITSRKRENIEKTQEFLKNEFKISDKQKYEFEYKNIYNLGDEKFDFIFCFGVLYHLKNPYLALENLFNITKETLIIETQGIKSEGYLNAKIGDDGFIRHSSKSLKYLLSKVGFRKVDVLVDAHDSSMQITNIVLKAIK